ncbi:Zinc-dependent sulfurtransferase SufU [Caprobacter fermentans]|uniref:SUF system NifU family Fe-S cluster assembly protein n=1 Tax=Caproicibacter fermentans TaxID=2576756 RepID=A0A6N8HVJ5_9FIRM|nr:SUF system NifU family Fe-S cluster assembly protein [Caproicibacter fermentans]MVB09625.1 Zinc-dependent sulfurtransferase SufU [Caproicibacter fermentans]OCN01524.1 SUF system NifU family Fe-S cluster assembly protein [Clostridium sp. W14A]QNK40101.1 SUF system NifU family Fe-S cluster assembly protein [Caproicibacter fermentans]
MGIENIYTQILTEHNNSSRNKHHIENPTAVLKGVNPSCGDEIELELREKDGVIEDAGFTGIGCAISQASASIMIDLIKGQTKEEALRLANLFFGMIKNEVTDESQLEDLDEAIALKDISHMPARVKCAVLGWHTLENAIHGERNPEKS